MPKKTKVLSDKYKSTTKIYPKIIMASLTPEVREYIESQGGQEETLGNFTTKSFIDKWGDYGIASVIQTKKDDTHFAECRVYGNKVNDVDVYGAQISYREGTSLVTVGVNKDGILLSGIDKDINIETFGTSKLYINGVEYTGGGTQLYQHNIQWKNSTGTNGTEITLTIINDSDTPYTSNSDIASYLYSHGFISNSNIIKASGSVVNKSNSNTYIVVGFWAVNATTIQLVMIQTNGTIIDNDTPHGTITDNVVAL